MAASGSGGNEPGGRPWTATSTWTAGPGGGAVEDAVSFETTDDDAEASPAGVVLCHPPADSDGDMSPCPCEVTVSFRGKYEIHRVYVRSTARIYELYHSPDAKGTSKDYLCTVRCGLAVKEPQPSGEENMSLWTGSALNSDKRELEAKSVSSGSDEDSWVDVKITESPTGNKTLESQERNAIRTCQENTLEHYEATAEMTDVNPCVSLTIRFLSLQSKTSVHIEEIYIFADPVESTNDISVTGPDNIGGSSLLAMLVPGLMQMSKSRNVKIDDSYFSDRSRNQESSTCERVTKEAGLCSTNDSKYTSAGIESGMSPTVGVTVSDEKSSQVDFQFKDQRVPLVKDQQESNTDHVANPPVNENFIPYNRIERKLDTLLSKVEKMELYCSRFENSMIKPLGSIEARLQRLEEQFSSFSMDIQSLRGGSAFRPGPDGMSNMMSSQEETHSDANGNSTSTTDRKPGLAVRSRDFMSDDSCGYVITNGNHVNFRGSNVVPSLLVKGTDFTAQPELTDANLHDGSASEERKTSPGLVVKVPEFLDDDDEEEEEEEDEDEDEDDDDDDDEEEEEEDEDEDDDDDDDEEEEEEEEEDDDEDDTNDSGGEDNIYDNDEVEEEKQAEVCGDGDTKSIQPVSINAALASALEALLISTKGTSTLKPAVSTCDLGAENVNDFFSCSLSPGKTGEMSTRDGSADQFLGTSGDANLVRAIMSSQDIDTTPNNSLSKEMFDSKVEINEQNDDLSTEKVAFVAITEPLDVPPRTDTIDECIDDGSCVNRQNNGPNLDTMPYVVNCEPLDPPKTPILFEPVDSGVQVNENRPSISSVEFHAERNASSCKNGTSEACLGNGDAEKLSFERESAGAGKNLKNISQLLVKKALEVDVEEINLLSGILIGAKFQGSSSLAPRTSGHDINNTKEAVSDMECGLKDTESGFRLSSRMDSTFSQYHATDPQKKLNMNSSLDWTLDESFSKQNREQTWSSLSSTESFSGAPARKPVFSGNYSEELLAGIGNRPIAPLISVDDLLYEFNDDMLGMTSTAKGTNKSSPSLEVLLAESSDSEGQISDLEGIDSGASIGSARLFSTLSSSDDDDASVADDPLVDVADLTTPSEPYTSTLNEPLVDVADLTNPLGIDASSVNEPSADVVDLLHTSNEGDLSNPPETSFDGNSGEHPDSLI